MYLRGKKIILGVTGSIAAYKTPLLVRLLVKAGAEVRVVMTKDATSFVTPLTLSTVSKNPVYRDFSNAKTGEWVNHVAMGLWADLIVLAPLSANTLAKMAHGFCDNLLMAIFLSARCPVLVAPAMDLDMWKHSATMENLAKTKKSGVMVLAPAHGELASGLTGEGRMEEPENIFHSINEFFEKNLPLKNKRVLVTAGPTYEKIDAVRFIGNRSSGKMGFAIAEEFAALGADVTLVSGPSEQVVKSSSVQRINVESAASMHDACFNVFNRMDIVVMCAAVADYTVSEPSFAKMKKKEDQISLSLVPTRDILAEMGKSKGKNQFLAGFALETDHELENARLKIKKKNLDLIVLNSLRDTGAGFGHDTNKITLIDNKLKESPFDLSSKEIAAKNIVRYIVDKIK
jgi:phosphopantothenoylcysteine decarboxylase/phosphopantothenate--cysteine ligase